MPLHKSLAVLALIGACAACFADDDPKALPALMVTPTGNSVVYNVLGGFPQVGVQTTPAIGWAPNKLGGLVSQDLTIDVTPGTPGDPLDFMKRRFGALQPHPQTCDFVMYRPEFDGTALSMQGQGWQLRTVTIPALDGASKDPAYLTIQLTGGGVSSNGDVPFKMAGINRIKQKAWLPSNFRLSIGGADTSRTGRIDAITIKQSLVDVDGDGTPDVVFTASTLGFVLPAADCGPFLQDLKLSGSGGGGAGGFLGIGDLALTDRNGAPLSEFLLGGLHTISVDPFPDPSSEYTTDSKANECYLKVQIGYVDFK